MRIIRILCLILCLSVLLSTVPVLATESGDAPGGSENTTTAEPEYQFSTGDSSVLNGNNSLNAQVPLWGSGRLLETAGAAMLYEISSDTMVYSWNADLQIYPAALVKIMTCLLALENGTLTDRIVVTSTAMATLPKDTVHSLEIGEVWTLEQLLYCMMVGGYNDAAVVIAEYVAGSQVAFVQMMNKRAKEIGCTSTNFTNAMGFHDENQLSTVRDLVKILRTALDNELFFQFFSETSYQIPKTEYAESRYMETTNYMMTMTVTAEYYDGRVTGGRTGVTQSRERCLVVTAKDKGLHYIAIVMGAKATADENGDIIRFGSYEEVKELLNLGFDGFQVTQVLSSGQILTQYPVLNGQNSVTVGPSQTHYTVLPADTISTDLSYRYHQSQIALNAPVKAGEYVTDVQVWYGNVCVAQSPIVTKNGSAVNTIEDQSVMIQQNNDGLLIALRVVGILVAVTLIIALTVFIIRWTRTVSRRAQHRRRRRSRRRSK